MTRPRRPTRRIVAAALAVAGLWVILVETRIVYFFMPAPVFSWTMEHVAQIAGSEDRLVWLLERQGFWIAEIHDLNASPEYAMSRFLDCNFEAGQVGGYLDCREKEYLRLADELGFDPAEHATGAFVDTMSPVFFICGRNLSIVWIAEGKTILKSRALSGLTCI